MNKLDNANVKSECNACVQGSETNRCTACFSAVLASARDTRASCWQASQWSNCLVAAAQDERLGHIDVDDMMVVEKDDRLLTA